MLFLCLRQNFQSVECILDVRATRSPLQLPLMKERAAFILPALTPARLKSPGTQPAHTWCPQETAQTQQSCPACTRAFKASRQGGSCWAWTLTGQIPPKSQVLQNTLQSHKQGALGSLPGPPRPLGEPPKQTVQMSIRLV